jgi:hypothetical protein
VYSVKNETGRRKRRRRMYYREIREELASRI